MTRGGTNIWGMTKYITGLTGAIVDITGR